MDGRIGGPGRVKAQNLGDGVAAPDAGECRGCKAKGEKFAWHDELNGEGLCRDCSRDLAVKAKLGSVVFRFVREPTPREELAMLRAELALRQKALGRK